MNKKPNILMIVTDQEYAHQPMPAEFALPSRERIRARGVTFNHHHCTTTVCTPSRSVMLTGRHTPHTRMFDNLNFVWIDDMKADPIALPTIGHMLRDLGYHTVYKGKWHLSEIPTKGSREAMEPYGFSEYQDWGDVHRRAIGWSSNKDPLIAAEAVDWLAKRAPEVAANKPWFMSVNFVNPHDVMWYDTDGTETVQAKSMFPIFSAPDTPLYRQKWQTTLPASFFDDLEGQPPAVRSYKRLCDLYYGQIPEERRDMWHNHLNYYLNCHLDVDPHIGAVLDALEASGQADNTIVIFTADHGEQGGAHHLRQKGSVAFRETVNVPLVIVDPRHPVGGRTDAVGSHLDLVPTILTYAGLSEDERRKLYPLLKGHDLSGVVCDPASVGPRGSSATPGKGSLMTYDMIATIDAEWFSRNAVKVFDACRRPDGFHRGMERFQRPRQRDWFAEPRNARDVSRRVRRPLQAGPLLRDGQLQPARIGPAASGRQRRRPLRPAAGSRGNGQPGQSGPSQVRRKIAGGHEPEAQCPDRRGDRGRQSHVHAAERRSAEVNWKSLVQPHG